jgi:thiol-disulfide isomerase/thioredoxin
MNKKSFWIGFASGVVVFLLTIALVFTQFVVQPDISLNQVETQNLNQEKIDLTDFIGKPMVVNYWATWCAPCLQEFPYFEEIKQELGDEVNFIMISDESIDKIQIFSTSNPYTFNYLQSPKNLSEYGINARPTTYFYNSSGELTTKHSGSIDTKKLKELIEEIK